MIANGKTYAPWNTQGKTPWALWSCSSRPPVHNKPHQRERAQDLQMPSWRRVGTAPSFQTRPLTVTWVVSTVHSQAIHEVQRLYCPVPSFLPSYLFQYILHKATDVQLGVETLVIIRKSVFCHTLKSFLLMVSKCKRWQSSIKNSTWAQSYSKPKHFEIKVFEFP